MDSSLLPAGPEPAVPEPEPGEERVPEGTGSPLPRRAVAEPGAAGWLVLAAVPLLGLLLVPMLALLLAAPPATVARYLRDTRTLQAIWLSLSTSAATVLLALSLGTPLAYLLARRRFPGRSVVEVLVELPTVLPPAVAGLALLITFGRRGLLGGYLSAAGIEIAFTPLAVVLAQTFVAAPLFIRTAALGIAAVSRELERAAALDGAAPGEVLRYITLPLAARGILGGAALCWARAMGEFGATIIFAGNYPGRTQTMPLAVYLGLEVDVDRAITLGVILLVISFGVLLGVRAVLRHSE